MISILRAVSWPFIPTMQRLTRILWFRLGFIGILGLTMIVGIQFFVYVQKIITWGEPLCFRWRPQIGHNINYYWINIHGRLRHWSTFSFLSLVYCVSNYSPICLAVWHFCSRICVSFFHLVHDEEPFISSRLQRKLLLVRIFAYLSALAVLMVSGINLFRVIIHFTMKVRKLIFTMVWFILVQNIESHSRCLCKSCDWWYFLLRMFSNPWMLCRWSNLFCSKGGWWGPVYSDTLDFRDAQRCGFSNFKFT